MKPEDLKKRQFLQVSFPEQELLFFCLMHLHLQPARSGESKDATTVHDCHLSTCPEGMPGRLKVKGLPWVRANFFMRQRLL